MVFYHNCLSVQGRKPRGIIASHLWLFVSFLSCPDKITKWILQSNSSSNDHFPFDYLDFFNFKLKGDKKQCQTFCRLSNNSLYIS